MGDRGENRIYLDYNATTPVAHEVVKSITEALTNAWANPSSSSELGKEAKRVVNNSRASVAKMLGSKRDLDILFTSGGTEANNLVLYTALEYFKNSLLVDEKPCDARPHIVTTNVEHDAILLPLNHFEKQKLADVDYVPVSMETGKISSTDILNSIKPNTCLVSVMLANNETGVIMPVEEISLKLKKLNQEREEDGLCRVLLHTDAAQALGKISVNVDKLGVDYLTVVGHKIYGPRNGALYVRNLGICAHNAAPLYPMLFGGGQERSYRPGTENTPMISGLGSACELIFNNLPSYNQHMMEMRDLLQNLLIAEFGKDGVVFNCDGSERLPNTCNVSFRGTPLSGGDILSKCPFLMASTGAACHGTGKPSAILISSGVNLETARTAVRLSVGRETTAEEITKAVQMLKSALT